MTSSKQQTRRGFFKLTGGTAAVAGMAATGSLALPGTAVAASSKNDFSGTAVKFKGPKQAVNVFSEDGVLREVLFGSVDSFILPAYDPAFDFAGKRTTDLMKKFPGKTFKEADPEWFYKVKGQMERVVKFLEGRGIVVHRPAPLTEQMKTDYQVTSKMNVDVYARDGQVAVGNTVFETAFMTPSRGRNKHTFRYVTMELMRNGFDIKSLPQPLDTLDHDMDLEPLIEGGDVAVDHGNMYIGHSGVASNTLGYLWAKNAYPEWNVYQISISTKRFPHQHLDCIMNAFTDWGVVLEEAVGGIDSLPQPLRKKQWVKMTLEEAELKLGNFIAISPTEVVMATEAKRLREAIQAARPEVTIHHFPYYEVGAIGGSLRCNSHPIFREG